MFAIMGTIMESVMAKILVVEDDPDLQGRVKEWLSFEQHEVEAVADGKEAAQRLKFYKYELVILDWDLPHITGIDVCQQFRSAGGTTPIIMLTGKDTITDKLQGLDSGADDYITKPFHLKELSARIRALLRRPANISGPGNTLEAKGLVLDTAAHELTKEGQPIQLLPKEFALLEFFMRHPGEVFSPDALLDRVWNSESDSSIDTVYTYIKTLRKKISPEAPSSIIKTVHGIGYKLEK